MSTNNIRTAIVTNPASKQFIQTKEFADERDVMEMFETLKVEIKHALKTVPVELEALKADVESNNQDSKWQVIYHKDPESLTTFARRYAAGPFKINLQLAPDDTLVIALELIDDYWNINGWKALDSDMEQRCEITDRVGEFLADILVNNDESDVIILLTTPDFNAKAGIYTEGLVMSERQISDTLNELQSNSGEMRNDVRNMMSALLGRGMRG